MGRPSSSDKGIPAKAAKECHFIEYKDQGALRRHLTGAGKIHSRKRAGNCAKCQRLVQQAIKRARFMGILSYTN